MTKPAEAPADLDEHALCKAVAAVRAQAWCPRAAEIPRYEMQTLLAIAVREYLAAALPPPAKPQAAKTSPEPAPKAAKPAAKRAKGPARTLPKAALVMRRDNYVCYLCEAPIPRGQRSVDHVVPKSKGGSNGIDNLRAAHKTCNVRKGDMLLEEYRRLYPLTTNNARPGDGK